MAVKKLTIQKPKMSIMGVAGSDISGGEVQRPFIPTQSLGEDYNTKFTIDMIDKMVNGDGQVFAVWNAISLAIQQADWDMVPFSDDPKDKEIAEFLEVMIRPMWPDILRQALNCLLYGFMLFEPIYEVVDGKVIWSRLAPRLPWTVQDWIPDDGYLKEVVQYAWDYKADKYKEYKIPGTKILRFTNRQNGYNFEGQSILRGAYKHWDHKNTLYNVLIIRHERYGIGVPVGTLDSMATDEQMKALAESMKNMRSNELGYLLLPRGTDIDKAIKILVPEGGEAGATGLIEAIEHHNVQIARSVLAQFINLGDTKTGARAVAEDMSSLFLMSLGAFVKYISQIVSFGNFGENEGLKYLVDVNFGEVEGYPVWKCEKIKKDNSSAVLATIAQLVQSGALIHDESLEKHTRRLVGVPTENLVPTEPLETEITQDNNGVPNNKGLPTEKPATPATPAKPEDTKLEQPMLGENTIQRLPWEENVDFARIESVLDTATSEWKVIWRKYLKQQLDALGDFVGGTVTGSEAKQLSLLKMPFIEEMSGEFLEIMNDVYVEGRASVRREFIKQTDTSLAEYPDEEEQEDEDRMILLAIAASSAASSLSEIVHRSIIDSVTTEIASKGEARWDDVSRRAWSISDTHVDKEAQSINWAFGFGRENYATEYETLIQVAYYSAVLDLNTCYVCSDMHGRSSEEGFFTTPNPDCLGNQYGSGGNPCRCITIWVLKQGVSVSQFM